MLGGPTALSNRIDQSGPCYLVAFQMEIKPKPEGLGEFPRSSTSTLPPNKSLPQQSTNPLHKIFPSLLLPFISLLRRLLRPGSRLFLLRPPNIIIPRRRPSHPPTPF